MCRVAHVRMGLQVCAHRRQAAMTMASESVRLQPEGLVNSTIAVTTLDAMTARLVVMMSSVGARRHMMSHTSTSGTEPSSA